MKEGSMDKEFIEVTDRNARLVNQFARGLYNSPYGWIWENGILTQHYPGFKIKCEKELSGKNYKTYVVFCNNINKEYEEKLVQIATDKKLHPKDIKKMAEELKSKTILNFINKGTRE
jgi:hypothetical protein